MVVDQFAEALIRLRHSVLVLKIVQVYKGHRAQCRARDLEALQKGRGKLTVSVAEAKKRNRSSAWVGFGDPEEVKHTRLVKMEPAREECRPLFQAANGILEVHHIPDLSPVAEHIAHRGQAVWNIGDENLIHHHTHYFSGDPAVVRQNSAGCPGASPFFEEPKPDMRRCVR